MSLIPNQASIFNLLEKENGKVIKNTIEKRRESSKCAARERRGKETCIFDELKYEVPVVNEATVTHVDRIALLRVAATLCRLRKNGSSLFSTSDVKNICKNKYDSSLYNETSLYEILDGFILVVDSDDTILYSTESISMYLGLTQTDVVGHSLKEYCHSIDHSKLVNSIQSLRYDETFKTSVCLRMKTVVSPRGRNLNLKSAIMKSTYCTIKCLRLSSGWLSLLYISTEPVGNGSITQNVTVLAKITHDEGNGTFVTRHTCDMRFSFVGENFNSLLKKDSRSMVGTSFYDLVHPADVLEVGTSIKNLFETGHAQTIYYRLIAPEDSLVYWMVTVCNTVKHTSKGQKGQYVICMHYYLGSQKEDESYMTVRNNEGRFNGNHFTYLPALVSHQNSNIPSKINQLNYDIHDGNNNDNYNTEANEESFIGLAPKFIECGDFVLQSPCLPLFLEEDSIPNDFHDLFNNLLNHPLKENQVTKRCSPTSSMMKKNPINMKIVPLEPLPEDYSIQPLQFLHQTHVHPLKNMKEPPQIVSIQDSQETQMNTLNKNTQKQEHTDYQEVTIPSFYPIFTTNIKIPCPMMSPEQMESSTIPLCTPICLLPLLSLPTLIG